MRSATRCVALSRAPALPTHALGGVLEYDAAPQQVVADAIRLREVPLGARSGPPADQVLDLRVEIGPLSGMDAEDLSEGAEHVPQRFQVLLAEPAGVERGVGLPDQLEQVAERAGGVQVVVELLEHTLEPLPRLDGQLSAARRESRTELLETDRQVVQSGERRLALRQALEGEVERFAVVHRDQVIADAPHVVASRAEVAEGEEVALRFRHLLAVHDEMRACPAPAAGSSRDSRP